MYCNHKEPGIRLLCLCGLAFCNDNFSTLEQSNKLLDLLTDYLELQLDYAKKNKQRASDFVLHHANRQTDARQNAANIGMQSDGQILLIEQMQRWLNSLNL